MNHPHSTIKEMKNNLHAIQPEIKYFDLDPWLKGHAWNPKSLLSITHRRQTLCHMNMLRQKSKSTM